jgi:hypothetical protein
MSKWLSGPNVSKLLLGPNDLTKSPSPFAVLVDSEYDPVIQVPHSGRSLEGLGHKLTEVCHKHHSLWRPAEFQFLSSSNKRRSLRVVRDRIPSRRGDLPPR